ncbi:MAG: zinc ribbon domain-containing protein [Nitrospinota bacterium]|nr:zinc ribbon domain-containing protein [Nitrospinota bacterium]
MPIYEFNCSDCDAKFEEMRLSSGSFKGVECPKCGSKKVKKAFSTFAPSIAGSSSSSAKGGACNLESGGSPCSSGMCGFN